MTCDELKTAQNRSYVFPFRSSHHVKIINQPSEQASKQSPDPGARFLFLCMTNSQLLVCLCPLGLGRIVRVKSAPSSGAAHPGLAAFKRRAHPPTVTSPFIDSYQVVARLFVDDYCVWRPLQISGRMLLLIGRVSIHRCGRPRKCIELRGC